jgi:NDP-sugar pyrophosphorylase family protein
MVPIAGRPILEWVLLSLRHAGIDEAVIVYGYKGQAILDYFGDGAALGMRLSYREQTNLCGTAGAMLSAEDLMGDEPFFLQWGDMFAAPDDYPAILARFHDAPDPLSCVLGVTWVGDPYKGGAVHRDGNRVVRVEEKPAPGTAGTHWVIAGLIALAPSVWEYLHRLPEPVAGEYYITEAIDLMIRDGLGVEAYALQHDRVHVTTPDDVHALNIGAGLPAWERTLTGK